MIIKNMSSLPKSNKVNVRSPLFYVGDKYKLLSQLLALYPRSISRFIEPFTGGGSVAMNVQAKEYLLNDIDPNIATIHALLMDSSVDREKFFKTITDLIYKYDFSRSFIEDVITNELHAKWKKTYYAKFNDSAYRKLREDYNKESPRDPYKLYLLLIYGFNRMIRFNANGDFNVPVGNVDFNKNVIKSLNSYFDWALHKEIQWSNKDYLDFINSLNFRNGDFVYVDPPYLITSSEYNKLWDESKEIEMIWLLDSLNDNNVRFAVSNVTQYKGRVNNTFLKWSEKYKSHTIKSNYISYHDNSIKDFTEVLVTNF